MTQKIDLPVQYVPCKTVQLKQETKDAEVVSELVNVYASDETPIVRFSWEEWDEYYLIFSHDPTHVRLDRVANGVCLFFSTHPGASFFSDKSERLGKAIASEILDNHLELSIRLGSNESATRYKKDLDDGIAPGVSIGAQVYTLEVVQEAKFDKRGNKTQPLIVKAVDWELLEISAADIPANPNARVMQNQQASMKFTCNVIGRTGLEEVSKSQQQKTEGTEENTPVTTLEVVQSSKPEDLETIRKLKIERHYWQLRSQASNLLYENKITEADFNLDFSTDPQKDIEKLLAMEPVDSRAEFKVIERSLNKATTPPIERKALSDSDRTLLNNGEISKPLENRKTDAENKTPDNSSIDDYAQRIVKKIGR